MTLENNAQKPFTPDTLADRWGVSATKVRNMCNQNILPHFRLGTLYRIPMAVVEEYESCQKSQSEDSEVGIVSLGARAENENAISLRHAQPRKPRQKAATNS